MTIPFVLPAFKRRSKNHVYLAMTYGQYISFDTPGMTLYNNPGVALGMLDPNGRTGYDLAHEMGHAYGMEHAPSPGANGYYLSLHVNRIDETYPYSGNGMSAGYGYSALNGWFNKELVNHWDPMSYTSPQAYNGTFFSDHFYSRLLSNVTSGGSTYPVISIPKDANGILMFGANEASQVDAQVTATMDTLDMCIRPGQVALTVTGAYVDTFTVQGQKIWPQSKPGKGPKTAKPASGLLGATSLKGPTFTILQDPGTDDFPSGSAYPDPMLGDPDDPTPPIMIVTKAPLPPSGVGQ